MARKRAASLAPPPSDPATDMIERVAQAIYRGIGFWDQLAEGPAREQWRRAARHAVEAMREPNEAMIASGGSLGATSSYRAMIAAALGEPTAVVNELVIGDNLYFASDCA